MAGLGKQISGFILRLQYQLIVIACFFMLLALVGLPTSAMSQPLPPPLIPDISIDCDFSDWTNGTGTEIVVDDEGGEDDWKSPGKLDLTRFGVASNMVDSFYVLMGFDDILAKSKTAGTLVDTDLDDNANYAFVATVGSRNSTMELYSCDDTLVDACGNASLVKSYRSPGDFCVGSGAGPWNTDIFTEAMLPLSDLSFSGGEIVLTSLVSYAARTLLTSPKDSIFGPDDQNYNERIRCDTDAGTCEIIGAVGTPNISGTVYSDEGATSVGSGKNVRLLTNGVDAGSDTTNLNGDYFISIPLPVSPGDQILVYIDDDATYQGTTVTVFDGDQLADLDIYAGHVVVRHDNGGSLSNSHMSAAKGGYSDGDILYSVSGGALIVNGSDTELYVPSVYRFAPGGNITTPSMKSLGIFTGGSETIDVNGALLVTAGIFIAASGTMSFAGDFIHSSGLFEHNNGTMVLDGTSQTISGSTTFYNLRKTVTVADTLTFETGSTQTVVGTVTLQGTDGNLLNLRSSSAGTRWNLTVSAGAAKDISYVAVQDSDASGSDATRKPINPVNSVDSGNTIDWFSSLPDILLVKSAQTFRDPFNGETNPKAIPGAVMLYTIGATNQGEGTTDADTVFIIDPIPANTALFVGDIDGPGPADGPVLFTDGTPPDDSGLSYTFTSLDDLTDDVAFSNDGGTTYNYIPVPVNGFDTNITHMRVNLKGTFHAVSGLNTPGFEIKFKAMVE